MITKNGPTLVRYRFLLRNDIFTCEGAPETGDIPDAMHKPDTIQVKPEALEYAPTGGTKVC